MPQHTLLGCAPLQCCFGTVTEASTRLGVMTAQEVTAGALGACLCAQSAWLQKQLCWTKRRGMHCMCMHARVATINDAPANTKGCTKLARAAGPTSLVRSDLDCSLAMEGPTPCRELQHLEPVSEADGLSGFTLSGARQGFSSRMRRDKQALRRRGHRTEPQCMLCRMAMATLS